MSYNIIRTEIIKGELTATGQQLRELYREYQDQLAESCFLHEQVDLMELLDGDQVLFDEETGFDWAGTWSGNGYETFLELANSLSGKATVRHVWEDGDIEEVEVGADK